jgi:hypothetical protein
MLDVFIDMVVGHPKRREAAKQSLSRVKSVDV